MAEIEYANSWVEIANRALGRIGKGHIDVLTSGDELTQYVNIFLGDAIEAVLSARSWSIKARVQLTRSDSDHVSDFDYAYILPSDIVNIISVDTGALEYTPEGGMILTDAEEVYLVYVQQPADPSVLPGYLKRAISTHLAFLLSSALTSSEKLATRMAQENTLAMDEAVRADARRFQPGKADQWYDEAR